MPQDIKKLYLFHLFLSVSLTAVGSFLFIDRLFLRLGLSMSQFGLIKGTAFLVPVTLNLVLSPYIAGLGRDREIVAVSYGLRVLLPYLFLLLPWFPVSVSVLTLICSLIFMVTLICPVIAHTSLSSLCRYHIPQEKLGMHMGHILSLMTVPSVILAVPASWHIDLHTAGSDSRFYGAFLHVFLATTLFILAAAWFILRLNPRKASAPRRRRPGFTDIAEPFRNRPYRVFLHASFMLSMVGTMITAFINPYLLGPQNLSMFQVSLITVLVSTLGVGLRRLWGHMCDEYGGRNVLRLSVVGVAAALFVLTGKGLIPVLIYAIMAWNVTEGLFGVGLFTGQQYLSLALSDGERTNVYIAATSFANGTGMFAGSLLGGFLLDWLAGQIRVDQTGTHYAIYFTYCALLYLVVGHFVTALRERRRRVSSTELVLRMYRALRSKMRR